MNRTAIKLLAAAAAQLPLGRRADRNGSTTDWNRLGETERRPEGGGQAAPRRRRTDGASYWRYAK